MSKQMAYDYEYGDINPEDEGESFEDFDQLLSKWNQFLHRELQAFKVIPRNLYGQGCACDLKTMFLEQNFSPDFVMTLIPRVNDCNTQCLTGEYNKYMNMFLSSYTNLQGEPMTTTDLGSDETFFYQTFLDVVRDKAIYNLWDYFARKP